LQISTWETIERVNQQLLDIQTGSVQLKQLERIGLEFNQLHYFVQKSAAGLPQQLRDVRNLPTPLRLVY
jgi:hypothetical protein